MTQAPEWVIDDAELQALADSYSRVARWYPTPQRMEKTADWFNALTILATVYGSRLVAFRTRKATETAEATKVAKERAAARGGVPTPGPLKTPGADFKPPVAPGGSNGAKPSKLQETAEDPRLFVPEFLQ